MLDPIPTDREPPLPSSRHRIAWVRAAVLASAAALMLPGAWGHSATVVEFAELPAGLAAWQRHALGIYRVCGPLRKFLYALPAYAAGVRVQYPPAYDTEVKSRYEWNIGDRFQEQHTPRYHTIYRWSRLLPILVTLLGGCLVCEFSTKLFGTWPGIVSLCVWCWLPPVLAHGSLVTSDVLSAALMVAAARTYWAFLLAPGPRTALPAGLALGLAVAAKFTLLVLYPCWFVLLIARTVQLRTFAADDPRRGGLSTLRLTAAGLLLFALSIVVIDGLYLFEGVGIPLSQWQSGRSSLVQDVRRLADSPATAWLRDFPLPVPLELVRGLDVQMADTERTQSAYLLGQTRAGGWWYWYAVAFLIKVPLPALALFGLSLVRKPAAAPDRDPLLWAALCLLLPAAEAALAIAATTGTGTNAAFRYLLPSIALLCVWAGRAASTRSMIARGVTAGLLAWLLLNTGTAVPDHLAWRNELGSLWSRQRPAPIGDSLDWGQDLARLGAWVARDSDEGSTLVYVYGLGSGAPYHLAPPAALPGSASRDGAAFLAVSEDILFGYESHACVSVAGRVASIAPEEREALLRRPPFDRVGRTIRIYRLRERGRDGAKVALVQGEAVARTGTSSGNGVPVAVSRETTP